MLRDENAVREAYAAYGGELYRFALRALDDPGEAEELVQETFLRAWRAADRFDPDRASLRTWLFAIARNLVTDRWRAAATRPWQGRVVEIDSDDPAVGVENDHAGHVLRAWLVEEALSRLTEDHRAAIVETYLRGRTYSEVAAELAIPAVTLRSRVFQALRALRSAMEEMGVDREPE